ncbi:MAG TPA: hypothetical protein DCE56_00475 [Cyanobacteria bacterium UBA8553]|nr:hypothetical protein [Cyanobacteria bacterium UBA8553]HAJ60990.1 hypothetical protein [Cyanobacteria bacterium UBA8543]
MKTLNFIRSLFQPAPTQPTIEIYGQASSSLDLEQIQPVMEWLMSSLLNAGYFGRSHLIWDGGDQGILKPVLTGVFKNEPVFLYRCGDRLSAPPEKCYWRLMGEHPSLRIYQLEVMEDE